MKLQDIIQSIKVEAGSNLEPVELTEEGKKKYCKAFACSGKYTFDKKEVTTMGTAMQKNGLKWHDYIVFANGLMDFTYTFEGQIIVLRPKN